MNMAIDEAILDAHVAGLVPPTLRVYGFVPPCVTIGLSQKMEESAVDRIRSRAIDVVRRPTGGRAVLHLNDFTYAFIGSELPSSITASYREICRGLINAFAEVGVPTELGPTGVAYRHLQDCFMATTDSDLHHGGTKLIGSAQVRRRQAVLQHGSVPLNQNPTLMPELLGETHTESKGSRHLNLFDLSGREISFSELENAFKIGFERAFGAVFEPGELTDEECDAAMMIAEKHMQSQIIKV